MHQKSKWVTLYLRKEKTIFSAKFLPPTHRLSPNPRWRECRVRQMWMGRAGEDTSSVHLDGSSRVFVLLCPQYPSPSQETMTLEGCAALWSGRPVSSPFSTHRFIFLPRQCFAVAMKLLCGTENTLPSSLKATWLGGWPRSTARLMHAMSIRNCFHLPFSYSCWMSMY